MPYHFKHLPGLSKLPCKMRTHYLTKDLYAITLFAFAQCIAFAVMVAFDNHHLPTRARDTLLIFIGGILCHAMVRAVQFAHCNDEEVAAPAPH